MVKCTGLENRQGFTPLVSSNLTASAKEPATKRLSGRFIPAKIALHNNQLDDVSSVYALKRSRAQRTSK